MRIDFWRDEGLSVQAIARKLNRSLSTVSRELARNTQSNGLYCPRVAQACRNTRRQAARPTLKLAPDSVLWDVVCQLLRERQWSPQEIAATLKRTFPDDPILNVSHETIYNAIYAQPRGELRRELITCLRQHRNKRLPRSRGTDRRNAIPDMISIHVRPPEIDDRLTPGHWEWRPHQGGRQQVVGGRARRTHEPRRRWPPSRPNCNRSSNHCARR